MGPMRSTSIFAAKGSKWKSGVITRRLKVPRRLIGYLLITPAIIYFLVFDIFPLFSVVQMSFTDVEAGKWVVVGLQNFVKIAQDPWFFNSLKAIGLFTSGTVVFELSFGMLFALMLNEVWFSTTLRNFVRGVFILPWVFSTAASGILWSFLLHPYGLTNYIAMAVFQRSDPIEFFGTPGMAMVSLILVSTWQSYPFYMIMFLSGLQAIPQELYEAAKVDGANAWQRFCFITLPQLRPVLIAVFTINVITTVGHVDLIRLLTRGGPLRSTETVAYYIYKTAMKDGNLGYGAAVSTLLLVVLTVFTYFYLRVVTQRGASGETGF
jgi:multiple sugar transport system permease protein